MASALKSNAGARAAGLRYSEPMGILLREGVMISQSAPGTALETAYLGGGCFWCTEAVFARVKGVVHVESGYTGGHQPNPTYEQICAGDTGHAEVVKLQFDPSVIGFRDLLEIFFTIHDPTTLNRQGNDVGTQYRSVIFYQSPQQEATAR